MPYKERFTTSPDDVTIFRCNWSVEKPRGAAILVHGYAEHCGRYDDVARQLNEAGISVFGYDQKGMGRSGGSVGRIESYEENVRDLVDMVANVRSQVDCPICVIGHSYGGSVAVLYLKSHADAPIDGLVLSSPAFQLVPNRMLQPLAGLLARWFPSFSTPGVELEALSRDPAVVQAASSDPLYYSGRIDAQTGSQIIAAGRVALAAASDINLPILAFHGTADRIANHKSTSQFVARSASKEKSFHSLNGAFHEALNDSERDVVLGLIVDFIGSLRD